MFDTKKEFEVHIASGGDKTAVMRFPTDEEWCARTRAQKIRERILGRGKSKMESGNNILEADAKLFEKVHVNGTGPAVDEYDAAAFIERLERCIVEEVERQGNDYRVTMKVPGARVVHVLKMPTEKDKREYGRHAIDVTREKRHIEQRVALEPSGELWDRLKVSVEGYAGEPPIVPIVHKDKALMAVLEAVNEIGEDDDPED